MFHYGKVKVSNDQELLQLQHKSHPKYPCGKKEEKKQQETKLVLVQREHIISHFRKGPYSVLKIAEPQVCLCIKRRLGPVAENLRLKTVL